MNFRGLLKTTNYFRQSWKKRVIDWKEAYFTPDHPHRERIIEALRGFAFRSILEPGCAAGANLYKIKQNFPHADVGGLDWNEEAIKEARKMLPMVAVLQVGEATDMYLSDKGADMVLTDMCLIYLSPKEFRKALREIRRVVRVGVVMCEFNEPNWFRRVLIKLGTGYNAYDYRKELERAGFHDIEIKKLTEEDWPGTEKEGGLRCIITAR